MSINTTLKRKNSKPELSSRGLKLTEQVEGWPGSGFKRSTTEMYVRRVTIEGERDELQISFSIYTYKGNTERLYQEHGSLTIPTEHLEALFAEIHRGEK
jgi:hypothetical protein